MVKRPKRYYLELGGLFLVLFSVWWQVFWVDGTARIATAGEFTNIREQLYLIWAYLDDIPEPAENAVNRMTEYSQLSEDFYKAYSGERYEFVETQTEFFKQVQFYTFGIGSAMLFWARRLELIEQFSKNSSRKK